MGLGLTPTEQFADVASKMKIVLDIEARLTKALIKVRVHELTKNLQVL